MSATFIGLDYYTLFHGVFADGSLRGRDIIIYGIRDQGIVWDQNFIFRVAITDLGIRIMRK